MKEERSAKIKLKGIVLKIVYLIIDLFRAPFIALKLLLKGR